MQPIDIAWQLLKEVGVEGPADPHRMGEYRDTRTHMQPTDDLPPEAYKQLNQSLEQEAALRNMPTDESEIPPPPGPEDNMRIMPPRSGDFRGLPPNMQDYARQLSARRGRPAQGTSVQDPNQVLRSMSPIDLAMGMLRKDMPGGTRDIRQPGKQYRNLAESGFGERPSAEMRDANYEQFAPHAMTAGADTPEDISQEEYQEYLDYMADPFMNEPLEDTGRWPYSDGMPEDADPGRPSEIPVEDPASHQRMDDAHQEGIEEGVDMQQTRTPPADVRFRSPEEGGRRDPNATPPNPFSRGPSL